jgi:hypothetical protein
LPALESFLACLGVFSCLPYWSLFLPALVLEYFLAFLGVYSSLSVSLF